MLIRFILVLVLAVTALPAFSMQEAENFTLKDYNGEEHQLTNYTDNKAIVVMFIATRCPVSNDYNDRMVELYNDYADKSVAFLGINSNKSEPVKEIKEHAEKHGFQFPVLKDHENVIADRFGATRTPEVYVLDPELNVVYHGRIDDSQRESQVETQDLRTALDQVLAGKPVSNPKTKAFGCTIKKVD